MRVVDAAALTAAALLLSSTMASAQGIGDVAAKEKEKRKANPPPAKVITDTDIEKPRQPQQPWGASTSGSAGGSYTGTGVAGAPAGTEAAPAGTTADPAKTDETKPPTLEEQQAKEEEERNKAQQVWREEVTAAQKDIEAHQQNIGRLTDQLNDFRYGFNTPSVARSQRELEEEKTKLAEAQAKLETLQNQGRRDGYR